MSNVKKAAVIIVGMFLALLLISFAVGSIINLLAPPSEEVSYDNNIVELEGGNAAISNGGGSGHYHTVVPDRYSLSRTDPGAYYDHYEYGDNYDIDDYLEFEGYD